MGKDDRKLLAVLKRELAFLQAGGYRRATSALGRFPNIFQDSPTCLNFERTNNPKPCHECVMASLVPPDCLGERFPCRHIALNKDGYTIDTYCRLGTFPEAESAVECWLRARIAELECSSAPTAAP